MEKCRNICSELDSILKQYKLFVDSGRIDMDLFSMTSHVPTFSQIPSFYKKKYGYLIDITLKNIASTFFSNQCILSFTEHTQEKYNTFWELIKSEKTHYANYYDYQKPLIDNLLEMEYLYIDRTGIITYPKEKILVLKDYYDNEVFCTTYLKSDYINSLIINGSIVTEGTLFSKPEQDYLNYMLNNSIFDNGPALRNKYIHGSNPLGTNDHKRDYFQFLKIFALIVLKINEEFCRREDVWNK